MERRDADIPKGVTHRRTATSTARTHLVPEHLDAGQHGARGHEPAVAQLALRDVTRADAVHEQARFLADLLWQPAEAPVSAPARSRPNRTEKMTKAEK